MKKMTALLIVLLVLITIPMALAGTYECQRGTSHEGGLLWLSCSTGSKAETITFNMTKGKLTNTGATDYANDGLITKWDVYGCYEIVIYYWDGNTWKLDKQAMNNGDNYDIYNKKSVSFKLSKKNTDYQIKIWSWNPSTIAKSYHKNGKIKTAFNNAGALSEYCHWKKMPSCTISSKTMSFTDVTSLHK